jgi:integrase
VDKVDKGLALTAKRVAKLLRKGEPGRHLDRRGLYLVVKSRTNAHWEKRYQYLGRERYTGLGSAFTFSLVEARERSRRASQLLADGVDPLTHKREAKAERIAAAAKSISFGEVAADYYRAHSPSWKHVKHVAQWRATVLGLTLAGKPAAGDYCRALRPLPVAQIDTPLVLQVLRPLWHDKPETMSRVRARIAAVLDYAKASGYRTGDNPASWDVIGKLLPARSKVAPVNHFEAVDYREVPAFVAELRKREGTSARALEFAILTAARSAEVREATWREIDLDDASWTIPASRMKAGKEHKVPLTPEALELLRGLYREGDGDDALVFLGPQPGKPLSATALVRVMQRMGHDAVPHGFRSSFSDWAHDRTGHSNHAIELSLAHSIGAAAEKAYRRGDMLEKRRKLMEAWSKYVTSAPAVEAAGKVLPMRGQR